MSSDFFLSWTHQAIDNATQKCHENCSTGWTMLLLLLEKHPAGWSFEGFVVLICFYSKCEDPFDSRWMAWNTNALTLYLRENLKFDRKHGICSHVFPSRGHQGATEDEVRGFRDSPFSSLELWWARKGSVVRPQNYGWMLTHRTYFTRPSFGIKLESMDVDECLWCSESTHVWAGRSWERGKQH